MKILQSYIFVPFTQTQTERKYYIRTRMLLVIKATLEEQRHRLEGVG